MTYEEAMKADQEEKLKKQPWRGYKFAQDPGDKEFVSHIWDDTGKKLVESERLNIRDTINKRAKGMSLGEQLSRIAYGDLSCFKDGEPFYGDVAGMPEMTGDVIMQGQKNAVKLTGSTVEGFEKLKGEIDSIEDPEKKAAALKEYEVAFAKIQGLLGKE